MSGTVEIKKAVCMWCHSHCPVSVYIKDGRLEKLEEPQGHPLSKPLRPVVRGCPRARGATDWLYHPERLKYPLKRAGERGEGKWQEISWEQALDEVTGGLKEIKECYGAEAVATIRGTGRTHDEYRARFFNLFGSPNYIGGPANICFGPTNQIGCALLGWSANRILGARPGVTKCLLLIGANPKQCRRRAWLHLLEVRRSGAKLIVIDPRRTEPAKLADMWLQPRPGTDTALIMGLINVIIQEGLYDKEFVEKWCYGFDKLAEIARDYPPERVADITWVSASNIREAARIYATNRPAMAHHRMGLEHQPNAIQALRVKIILSAITGNIDAEGGDVLFGPPPTVVPESEIGLGDRLPAEQKAKQLGADRFKLLSWFGYDIIQENVKRVWGGQIAEDTHSFAHAPTAFRAMVTDQPYPVKALITLASNPMLNHSNTKLVYKALRRLDLHVVVDFWLTPTAELADYVFPAASWLERACIMTRVDTQCMIEAGEAAFPSRVEGAFDRRTDYDFWRSLGIRLGQEEDWPWKTLEEAYNYRLAPLGYTLKEFIAKKAGHYSPPLQYKKYEQMGFGTPTGKVELYSTILEKLAHAPLPQYKEPPKSPLSDPALAREYPLILITGGRFLPMYHSEHRQVESWRKQHPDPIMQIHPQKAAELSINDGDWTWIETPRGCIMQRCRYFQGIDPRVVQAEHGWWFPELPGEEPWLHGAWRSNINVIIDDDLELCDKISGGWPYRGELCRVYKVETF